MKRVLLLVALLGLAGCSSSGADTEASRFSKNVNVSLDVTTLEEMMAQMPNNIQPEMGQSGTQRTFVWTFGDGSKMLASFEPKSSGDGLVVSSIDLR
ncbi:MAG TPA: hypothetical protein VF681_00125 [Abditibacteriaceae bacterium]|jgi:ABC-type glycerol-3-phosphate transport system substrate-binding protein